MIVMQKKKQIQIDYDLFLLLLRFHCMDDCSVDNDIKNALEVKLDALVARDLYSKYKTAPTDEEREAARKEYLERKGFNKNFIW